jgi:hypothetical protein
LSTHKWTTTGTVTSYLTTELNSLADAANKLGAAINNTSNLNMWMDLEIVLASLTPGTGPYINVYFTAAVDGTNYTDGGDSVDPAYSDLIRSVPIVTGTGAKRVWVRKLEIPPLNFKILIENKAGTALASSGNTVKYITYNEQDA